jgi:hypothetical protein
MLIEGDNYMAYNLTDELNCLLLKYHILDSYPEAKKYIIATKLIKQLFQEFPSDSIIALRGGGIHAEQILSVLEPNQRRKVRYIIDKNVDIQLDNDISTISVDDISLYRIDVIIISSFMFQNDMEIELLNFSESFCVVNLYDYFQKYNLYCEKAFYQGSHTNYQTVFLIRKKYLSAAEAQEKEQFLQRLIANYIILRDFINAKKFIDEYINNDFLYHDQYYMFEKELSELFKQVKTTLMKRSNKDIVINWMDALKYDEIQYMNYIKSLASDSLVFENAFTVMPWTTMTMITMLTGKYIIDDKIYQIENYNTDNCELLSVLEDNGYVFKYYGLRRFAKRYEERNQGNISYIDDYEPSTYYQWDVLNILLVEKKPCFIIIHNTNETHAPHLSGCLEQMILEEWDFYKGNSSERNKQQVLSYGYLDNQIKWYDSFRSDNCVNIYLSDHGKSIDHNRQYDDQYLHVVMMVKHKSIAPAKIYNIFSLVNFKKLIYCILNREEQHWNDLCSEYAKFQFLAPYSKGFIDILFSYMNKAVNHVQLRGIRTEYDKYFINDFGKEFYFILPDEDTNLIEDTNCQKRINKLRNLAGNTLIDIYEDDFFIEYRKLYDYLKQQMSNTTENNISHPINPF